MSSRYYSVSDALTSRYGPKDEEETTPKRKNGNRKKTTARKRPASRVETSDNPFLKGNLLRLKLAVLQKYRLKLLKAHEQV